MSEIDHEKALADAEALSVRFVSSASKFRLTEADTLDVIALARAYIDRMEPVEIGFSGLFSGQCKCGAYPQPMQKHKFCPNCGKPIKWKDTECQKS